MSEDVVTEDITEDITEHMLTTVDNPFNPFTHFDEWNAYDQAAGYMTLSFLARIVMLSDELSEADQALAIEQGIEEIVRENVLGLYRSVSVDSEFYTTNN